MKRLLPMTTKEEIKSTIYERLVNTGLDKLTKKAFKGWYNEYNNQRFTKSKVKAEDLYDFYSKAYD